MGVCFCVSISQQSLYSNFYTISKSGCFCFHILSVKFGKENWQVFYLWYLVDSVTLSDQTAGASGHFKIQCKNIKIREYTPASHFHTMPSRIWLSPAARCFCISFSSSYFWLHIDTVNYSRTPYPRACRKSHTFNSTFCYCRLSVGLCLQYSDEKMWR